MNEEIKKKVKSRSNKNSQKIILNEQKIKEILETNTKGLNIYQLCKKGKMAQSSCNDSVKNMENKGVVERDYATKKYTLTKTGREYGISFKNDNKNISMDELSREESHKTEYYAIIGDGKGTVAIESNIIRIYKLS